jgi:hypothetical protein
MTDTSGSSGPPPEGERFSFVYLDRPIVKDSKRLRRRIGGLFVSLGLERYSGLREHVEMETGEQPNCRFKVQPSSS